MKLVRLLPALLTLVLACGGAREARSPAPSADGVTDQAPASIEEAQDRIAEAQQQLGGGLADPRERAKADDLAPAPPPPPPPRSSNGTDGTASGAGASSPSPAPSKAEADAAPVDTCIRPCNAFASMRRAVEALCRMTGETDERCVKARRTLDESSGRVAACRCR